MSSPVFQPGDKVRRIIDNWAGVKVGDIETVASMGGTYSPTVFLVGHSTGFMPSHFELVEARLPLVPENIEPDSPTDYQILEEVRTYLRNPRFDPTLGFTTALQDLYRIVHPEENK